MTRKEAKNLLTNISAFDIDNKRGMDKQEALEMAIEALEQQDVLEKIIDKYRGESKE